MTDQQPDLLTQIEQRQQRQDAVIDQIHEILLTIAQFQQESAARAQRIEQQQEINAQQIAANAQAIAQLQAILRDRYSGNGQG